MADFLQNPVKRRQKPPASDADLFVDSRIDDNLKSLLLQMGASLEPERQKSEAILKAEKSFAEFVKQSWPVIEPGCDYIHGWHIDAICEHLDAVLSGQIKKLLINMPPRHCKSTLVSVCWPAWMWIHKPWAKFLYSSYSLQLAVRDSVACRRLIASPWYQSNWGNVFTLQDDQNAKMRFENSRHGVRLSTSVGGTTTGEGGDFIVCFPYDAEVLTEEGPMKIGDIVENKVDVMVWSQRKDGQPALGKIQRWNKNPGREIVRVHLSDGGSFECTADHKIMTRRGWVEAKDLQSSDMLPRFSVPNVEDGSFVDSESPSQSASRLVAGKDDSNVVLSEFASGTHSASVSVGRFSLNPIIGTHTPLSNVGDIHRTDTELGSKVSSCSVGSADVGDVRCGKFSVGRILASFEPLCSDGVSYIFRTGPIGKVLKSIVQRIAVKMADVVLWRSRTEKGFSHKDVDISVEGLPVSSQADAGVSSHGGSLEQLVWDSKRESISDDDPSNAANPPQRGDFVKPLKTNDVSPVLIERDVFHVQNSYCLTVRCYHNFMVRSNDGYYIVASNCDDPHNVKEAESDIVRQGVLDWWSQAMSTRLNNPKTGAYIVVMQRVHEQDLAGKLVTDGGYHHLCLPARYEGQKTHWCIGWQDPRKEDGELLWPERFDEETVSALEKTLGSYAAAAQLQQRPTPAEGGLFKKQWFRTYDTKPPFVRIVESWDTATSEADTAAYSAGQVWGETAEGDYYLLHNERDRWDFPKLKAGVVSMHKKHNGIAILVEDKSSGRQICQELGRGKRMPIIPMQVGRQDKVARALACSALIESGRVFIPTSSVPWVANFMKEVLTFPKSQFKDQVDAMTQALNWMKGGSVVSGMDLS